MSTISISAPAASSVSVWQNEYGTVKVKMPDENTLRELLYAAGFEYFAEESFFVVNSANQEHDLLVFSGVVETDIAYSVSCKYRDSRVITRKDLLLKAIFKDHPWAIQELAMFGCITD